MRFFRKKIQRKYQQCSDEQLMQHLVKGDEKAFAELYDRYATKLYHYFYRMLGQQEQRAQDFVQDLFLRVIEKKHQFDCNRKFSTWLYTIAANKCKNAYRKQSKQQFITSTPNGDLTDLDWYGQKMMGKGGNNTNSSTYDKALFEKHLSDALAQLSHKHRTVFILRYQEELSIEEISAIMNSPKGTTKSRLHYTIKQLAEKLQFFNPNLSKNAKNTI